MSAELPEWAQKLTDALVENICRHLEQRHVTNEAPGAAALAPTGGSGGGDTDGASAHQPTPQVGDVWESTQGTRERLLVLRQDDVDPARWHGFRLAGEGAMDIGEPPGWRLIERNGKPWPPAQEQEPTRKSELVPAEAGATCDVCHAPAETCDLADSEAPHRCAEHVGPKPAREAPVGVEPATDRQIAELVDCLDGFYWAGGEAIRPLIARVRQEQDALLETNGWLRDAERERDEAVARAEKAERERDDYRRGRDYALADLQAMSRGVGELLTERSQARLERDEAMTRAKQQRELDLEAHDEAVARAEKAEAALARVEQVTAAERAVVEAAEALRDEPLLTAWDEGCQRLLSAVAALRDTQEAQ